VLGELSASGVLHQVDYDVSGGGFFFLIIFDLLGIIFICFLTCFYTFLFLLLFAVPCYIQMPFMYNIYIIS